MSDAKDVFGDLVNVALAIIKDKAIRDEISRVENAYRELLVQEAASRRKKNAAVIKSIQKIDIEIIKLESAINGLNNELSVEAKESIYKIIRYLKVQRKDLVLEKNQTTHYISESADNMIKSTDEIYGVPLQLGDVLAVTRKGGLYQHYAVYIGNKRVIHYAADKGDFSGRITIHEAHFSEFQAGALFVYVLDFPEEPGNPMKRGFGEIDDIRENNLFATIRLQGYHLYSPEETVERAKSRLGEEKYSLPFNNCEHFALWCKTGVSESHQFNIFVSKLFDSAKRKIRINE